MTSHEVTMRIEDAEKVVDLLRGLAILLRASPMPERLFDAVKQLEDSVAWEPLRYEIHVGPGYVADEVDKQIRLLKEAIPDLGYGP